MINRILPLVLWCGLLSASCAFAKDESPPNYDRLALLPVDVKNALPKAGKKDKLAKEIERALSHVIPHFIRDSDDQHWPVRIINTEQIQPAIIAIVGSSFPVSKGLRFNQFKQIAAKADVRYLAMLTIYDLKSYPVMHLGLDATKAIAKIDLLIYDGANNEFVWQKTAHGETLKMNTLIFFRPNLEGLREKVLRDVLLQAFAPFFKGERMKLARPGASIVTLVKKLIDKERVFLDAGDATGIEIGDTLINEESGNELEIVEVFDNGCVAKIRKGSPTEGENFRMLF
jgi:hypothetical protein